MVEIGDIWELELTIGKDHWLVVKKVESRNQMLNNHPDSMKWILKEVLGEREVVLHDKHFSQAGKKVA